MKALITGMGGFVGSHLAELLLDKTDWDVVGTLRTGEPIDNLGSLARRIDRGDRLRTGDVDLNDAVAIDRLICVERPNYVFHLAAQSFPLASFKNPAETLRVNILGTCHLLDACHRYLGDVDPCWVHVCSSAEVYGRTQIRELTEDQPFHAASPYSVSKIGADLLGQLYASYGLNVIVTRMFSHTGPRRGDVFMESSFAKQIAMIECGLMTPPIMVGNLDAVRTIADVRDAVRAYLMALTVNPVRGSIFNIGGDYVCTAREVLEEMFSQVGRRYDLMTDPARLRPVDADYQILDCSRFSAHTGWSPQVPFRQTIADLLNYWRARVEHAVVLQR